MKLVELAIKNVKHSKFRLIIISFLVSFGLIIFTITMGISSVAKEAVAENVQKLEQNNVLKISPRISGTYIAQSKIDEIKKLDNVISVISQYNIYGLLEEGESNPIYNVSVNGFDFNEGLLDKTIDYRGMNVSGIVLPALTVTLNGEKVMDDFIGRTVYFTYEYREGDKIVSETVECKVLGTYTAYGLMEENPVYMSLNLFNHITSNVCKEGSGILSLVVYARSAQDMNNLAETINNMGMDVAFESTKEDFINYINSFSKTGLIAAIVILLMAGIIIMQTINSNIHRREKVIGILKVYGYSNFSIYKMIIVELLIYYSIGMVLATLVCASIDKQISNMMSSILLQGQYTFGWSDFLRFVILGFVLSCIATVKPILKCKRLQPIDILKGET